MFVLKERKPEPHVLLAKMHENQNMINRVTERNGVQELERQGRRVAKAKEATKEEFERNRKERKKKQGG